MAEFTSLFSYGKDQDDYSPFDANTLAWRTEEIKRMCEFDSQVGYAGMIVYGLRQTGKTHFLKAFYKNKPCIFFEASRVSVEECFAYFKVAVDKYLQKWGITLTDQLQEYYKQATDFTHMFIFISVLAEHYHFTLVIDEFNYLDELIPHVSSSIQWVIDQVKDIDNIGLKVVICGSNVGLIQKVPSYDSPLYGRIEEALPFAPVSILVLLKLLPYPDVNERYMVATLTGGLPALILIAQQCAGFEEFVDRAFLRASSKFRTIPTNLLLANRIDPEDAIRIFNAVFSGASKLNDIKQKSGLDMDFEPVLNKLMDCGFIEARSPLCSNRKVKTYVLSNAALEFTYLFELQSTPHIMTAIDLKYSDLGEAQISAFPGRYFERVCREYLCHNNPLRTAFARIGYWEDTIKSDGFNHSEEFDIIAQTVNHEQLLVGECKYRNEVIDMQVYQSLKDKAKYVNSSADDVVYCLFSKSGFAQQLTTEAVNDPDHLKLYTLDDLASVSY